MPAGPDGPTGPGAPAAPAQPAPDDSGGDWIGQRVADAVDGLFRTVVSDALNPLLGLLGRTLLATPTPSQLPRIGELWESSRLIAVSCYVLLVLAGALLVMTYQTVQTRYALRDVLPRLVIGFLAANMSLPLAEQAITAANTLSAAVLGPGLTPESAGPAMREQVLASLSTGGLWLSLIGLALAVAVLAILLVFVIRVVAMILLVAAAPLALSCHALPQTEPIAFWWWKAFSGLLVIQLAQSLTLVLALTVFLTPGGLGWLGPNTNGLVSLIVTLALLYLLVRIPFWVLSATRLTPPGAKILRTAVRAFIAYKTFGLLTGRGRRHSGPDRRGPGGGGGGGGGGGPTGGGGGPSNPFSDPTFTPKTTAGGQYLLPLPGLRRTKRPGQPRGGPAPAASQRRAGSARGSGRGYQYRLPLDGMWPENRPVLGRDGQYQLPLTLPRTARRHRTDQPPRPGAPGRAARAGSSRPAQPTSSHTAGSPSVRAHQYRLPLGRHWPEHRPVLTSGGQYRLPIDLTPQPRPADRPHTRPDPTPSATNLVAQPGAGLGARPGPGQLSLPLPPRPRRAPGNQSRVGVSRTRRTGTTAPATTPATTAMPATNATPSTARAGSSQPGRAGTRRRTRRRPGDPT